MISIDDMTKRRRATLVWLIGCGFLLRSLRLSWQPLWWDEGYSVYFATEPLTTMLWLTAKDIHPPLYYALLHMWTVFIGRQDPVTLRLFSVFIGVFTLPLFAWMAQLFLGAKQSPTVDNSAPSSRHETSVNLSDRKLFLSSQAANHFLLTAAVALLVISPLHIYYSHEIRMYSLALLLTMWSTGTFWKLVTRGCSANESTGERKRQPAIWLWIGYVIATTLALYTLYYAALIPLAQISFILWSTVKRYSPARILRQLVYAQTAVALLYLPWVFFAFNELINYVDAKVAADNDAPYDLFTYLGRHIIAFLIGHLPGEAAVLDRIGTITGVVAVCIALIYLLRRWQKGWSSLCLASTQHNIRAKSTKYEHNSYHVAALWFLMLIPAGLGFVLNRQLTFSPTGGERLLLIVLPYFLLLFTLGISQIGASFSKAETGTIAACSLSLSIAIAGTATYFTVPRYGQRDYREVVRYIIQKGGNRDQILALFPWQVGYWRAYSPQLGTVGPVPKLIGEGTLEWSDTIRQQVDGMLMEGPLWFPAPLGLGSQLPSQIEDYLFTKNRSKLNAPTATVPFNTTARWANPTTFLTGWKLMEISGDEVVGADFGNLVLERIGVSPSTIAGANEVLGLRLDWSAQPGFTLDNMHVTLQLKDGNDRVWLKRDYNWTEQSIPIAEPEDGWIDRQGLIVSAGTPPGEYGLELGLSEIKPEAIRQVPFQSQAGSQRLLVQLGVVRVVEPDEPLSPLQLPIEAHLEHPITVNNVRFLGYESSAVDSKALAGTEIPLWLYVQRLSGNPDSTSAEQHLFVSALDKGGAGVAGWTGWPLPSYPLARWRDGALVKLPVPLQLPATVPDGNYMLITGLINAKTGEKSEAIELTTIAIERRDANLSPPVMEHTLPENKPYLVGSHVELIGYDLDIDSSNAHLVTILLHWHVLQSLLPPHHIFVHLESGDAKQGYTLVAQIDGEPLISTGSGFLPAPTGSWQPGEYLSTYHQLPLPSGITYEDAQHLFSGENGELRLSIGLYLPTTGVRLPVARNEALVGDRIMLLP